MSSLIFDEGASLKPAKTPHHDGLKTARKAALGSALPTPATHKLKPQTTAKRVLFGDITKGAANNATVRKADGGNTLEPTTQKQTGRKITFQTPAKSAVKKQISFRDDEGVEEAKAEPTIEEEAPALRRGQYRDDTEPIEKPLGRLFDNDALIKELNELDEKLNPDPFPEDAFGGDDDNFDAVEGVRGGAEPISARTRTGRCGGSRSARRVRQGPHGRGRRGRRAVGNCALRQPGGPGLGPPITSRSWQRRRADPAARAGRPPSRGVGGQRLNQQRGGRTRPETRDLNRRRSRGARRYRF